MSIEKILASAPVVPVVVIEKLEDAAPLARALYNGGLKALEITLRTPIAAQAVKHQDLLVSHEPAQDDQGL